MRAQGYEGQTGSLPRASSPTVIVGLLIGLAIGGAAGFVLGVALAAMLQAGRSEDD